MRGYVPYTHALTERKDYEAPIDRYDMPIREIVVVETEAIVVASKDSDMISEEAELENQAYHVTLYPAERTLMRKLDLFVILRNRWESLLGSPGA